MASSTIVHAAVFAVGAIVGGGVATAVASRNKSQVVPPPATAPPPMMDMKGKTQAVMIKPPPGALVQTDTAVLKYGNPGVCTYAT